MGFALVCSGCHNKILQTGDSNSKNVSSQIWEKSKVKVPANSVSADGLLSALQMVIFSLRPHRTFPLFVAGERVGGGRGRERETERQTLRCLPLREH